MPLPLILGLAGAAAGAYAGKNFFDDAMERRRNRRQAERFQGAVQNAQVGAGVEQERPTPGFVGPMPEATTTDIDQVGRNLLEAGDPRGMDLLLDQASARQQQRVAEAQAAQNFAQQQMLQQQKDTAAMARTMASNDAALAAAKARQQWPIAPGSSEWLDLNSQATSLNRLQEIIGKFRTTMMQGGAVPGTQLAAELNSIRAEAMSAISLLEEQGVIREGERDLWLSRIPDLVSAANIVNMEAWWPAQAGKIQALADLYNARLGGYNNAARLTAGLPQMAPITTRMDFADLGLRQVGAEEIGPIQGPPDLRNQDVEETFTGS